MLTLVMPYYENAEMLRLQFAGWKAWSAKHRKRLKVIIVDDGSPGHHAANVPRPRGLPELSIYRVAEDQPWHQHAARNLGAHQAEDGWLLLTDMDHVLPAESAAAIFKAMDKGHLDPAAIYTLDRVEADTGLPTLGKDRQPKPHPNSFLVTRELFWRIGGYDEAYAGIYGTDGLFRERAFRIGRREHLEVPLVRYWRDIVPDASTNGLPRKEGRDPDAKRRIAEDKARRGEVDKINIMQFAWDRVL